MIETVLSTYLKSLQSVINRGDGREESFYPCLAEMLKAYAKAAGNTKTDITILPKATDAGNPDFRVWDGKNHITGYIEAKAPHVSQLDPISTSEQLKRYLATFPNLILTNFYEFRLYQHGLFVSSVTIARATNAINLGKTPPLEHAADMQELLSRYFSFSLPAINDPKSLANALAKRTRFLRDEILKYELIEEQKQGKKVLLNFYDSFKKLLINNLTLEQFADLYAQTLTYGIFAARTRSEGEFNRELIYKYIPKTLGVLKSIFKFISYEEPPKALEVLIDDIAEILFVTDIKKILHKFYVEGKGSDPIIHFYETFLSAYDLKLRESRGVYYTPEPVVRYIVRSIHSLLKSHFDKADGLASFDVTLLDPAAGTLTFPAVAIRTAIDEYIEKYGDGNVHKLIKEHILPHFYAIELMMAPYTVGHLKIGYLLAEMKYEMSNDERFKLYLSNTLEPDIPAQMETVFTHEITEECELANKVKKEEPILVIMGNPPYSGESENTDDWAKNLVKKDQDGAQSYYKVDGEKLEEKNTKWLQNDYVKFLRFAQWKIHKAGKGIVGMITDNGYLENATFRGMRRSLMNTFDEIIVLDLHGSVKKKDQDTDGSKDENVFDIQQGTAIVLMVKVGANGCSPKSSIPRGVQPNAPTVSNSEISTSKVYHHELLGLRKYKYDWLKKTIFKIDDYIELKPTTPFYLFHPEETGNEHYLKWKSVPEILPVNNVGIVTSRDDLTIQFSNDKLRKTVHQFASVEPETARVAYKLGKDARDWKVELAQNDLKNSGIKDENIRKVLYRPFDTRFTYYTGKSRGFHSMPRNEVMKHMFIKNVALIVGRQGLAVGDNQLWNLSYMCNSIVDFNVFYRGGGYVSPLYLYPEEHKDDIFATSERTYNLESALLATMTGQWGERFQPEQLFYYIYAVLYSNIYRQRYAQYLRMDFPRIPFTENNELFSTMAALGLQLSELHLMTSPLLKNPIAKYQGKGNSDMVTEITYNPAQQTVKINPDKYFEGITPALWDYHIGGYQVLHKYLKDRKGKTLEDPIHYCRIVTALAKTMEKQREIDGVYEKVDIIIQQNEEFL